MTSKTFALIGAKFGMLAAAGAIALSAAPAHAQAPAAPPIEAYGALPAIERAVISNSGAYTAMLMTVNNQRQIMVLDSSGAPVKQFIVGDAKVRGIDWVGDEAILLRRSETQELALKTNRVMGEWMRANVLPLDDSREVISVFAEQRQVANFVAGFSGIHRVDGRWVGYFSGFRMGRASGEEMRILSYRPALFAVDLLTGETDQVAFPAGEGHSRDWIIGSDGKIAVTLDIDLENGKYTIKNPSGSIIARGVQEDGRISLRGLDKAGNALVYRTYDSDGADWRYFSLPLEGGQASELWSDIEVDWVIRTADERVLGVVDKTGGILLSNGTQPAPLASLLEGRPQGSVSLAGWTPDFSTLAYSTSGNYDSGSWFRMETASGSRAMLGLERPFIQGQAIAPIETFEYEAGDGLSLEGVLTLPPGREHTNLPAIVLPHGGPTAHDEPIFDWWAQAFAARGYAVIQPNFRGSTNRDEAFVEAGDGEWGGKMQTDIGDSLKALAERGIVDADRACIVGASFGGYSALAGVTTHQNGYRCAVGVNGVYDIEDFFRYDLSGKSTVFTRGVERLIGKNADLDALSPTAQASKASAPVLLIHGRDDTVVPFEQSVLMEDALSDAGKQVRLLELKGEDHWLSQAPTRTAMLDAAISFVEEHNPAD